MHDEGRQSFVLSALVEEREHLDPGPRLVVPAQLPVVPTRQDVHQIGPLELQQCQPIL